jgi:dihydrofolate synthase/folylpolyglutamate synthase
MTYDEALRYLASLEELGIRLALQNISQVLEALGNPERRTPSLLISGTNGKGSVAATLASILARSGRRTGLYTSPHLVRHEERIVIDGRPISPEEFASALTIVRDAIDDLMKRGRLQAHPTHFETITAAAFHHFASASIDFAVLEVGMGGRLDATVLARPRLSIITNVALEHTAFLGGTIGAIAAEKAGILPEGGLLLTAETQPEALEAFRARARDTGGRLVELGAFARVEPGSEDRLTVRTARRVHEDLRPSLHGPHQAANAALAVAACDLLEEIGFPIPEEAIRRGVETTTWPGRFQIVERRPRLILDGAHNPAACVALRDALASLPGAAPGSTTLIFGAMRDKKHLEMMAALFPRARRVLLTRGRSSRFREPHAILPEAIRIASAGDGGPPGSPARSGDVSTIVTVAESVSEALRSASEATPLSGTICVAGSLYLVGETMEILGIEPWPSPPTR